MGIQQIPLPSGGVTLAEITSSLPSTSDLITAPKWTHIATYNTNSGTSYTFSNLSGYNRYRLIFQNFRWNTNSNIEVRANGVTTDSYWQQGLTGTSMATSTIATGSTSWYVGYYQQDYGVPSYGWLEINNAGQAGMKTGSLLINTATSGSSADRRRMELALNLGENTAAITSLTVFNGSGATFNFQTDYPNRGIHLMGAN